VQRDYADAPEPHVLFFDPKKDTLETIRARVAAAGATGHPRVVLHASTPHAPAAKQSIPSVLKAIARELKNKTSVFHRANAAPPEEVSRRVSLWAKDSVGVFPQHVSFAHEVHRYGQLPSVKGVRNLPNADASLRFMRTCQNVFVKPRGNRTCFQICE
jgi:hypothetical protein